MPIQKVSYNVQVPANISWSDLDTIQSPTILGLTALLRSEVSPNITLYPYEATKQTANLLARNDNAFFKTAQPVSRFTREPRLEQVLTSISWSANLRDH